MFSNIHITASLQPRSGGFESVDIPLSVPNSRYAPEMNLSDVNTTSDSMSSILDRLSRLEAEVFQRKPISNGENVEKPISSKEGSLDRTWTLVFREFAKRLDACGSQQSMVDCVAAMKLLRQECLEVSKDTESMNMSSLEAFIKTTPSIDQPIPSSIVRFTHTKPTEWSEPGSKQPPKPPHKTWTARSTYQKQSSSNKKWGPCFYCPLDEWVPGHACEGSRRAQLKKKEKEINSFS